MSDKLLERRAEIGRERRNRTRAAILRAAFDLLGRENGRSSRIEDICEAADVSRATFYNYFSSIEELLKALSFEISHDFNDAVRVVILQMPNGAFRIAFGLRYYFDKTRRDPRWGWAMVHLSAGGPILGEEAYRYSAESFREGLLTEQFAVSSFQVGLDVMMGSSLAAMITLLRTPQAEDYPELMVAQIFRALGASETLIQKCISPALPDPYEFLEQFGNGTELARKTILELLGATS